MNRGKSYFTICGQSKIRFVLSHFRITPGITCHESNSHPIVADSCLHFPHHPRPARIAFGVMPLHWRFGRTDNILGHLAVARPVAAVPGGAAGVQEM